MNQSELDVIGKYAIVVAGKAAPTKFYDFPKDAEALQNEFDRLIDVPSNLNRAVWIMKVIGTGTTREKIEIHKSTVIDPSFFAEIRNAED